MTEQESFATDAAFERGEVSGSLRLGRLEVLYEELFATVIDDGVITEDERTQLNRMADSLGLDRDRIANLEKAFHAAYEAKGYAAVTEVTDGRATGTKTILPLVTPRSTDPAAAAEIESLRAQVQTLRDRIHTLEAALREARDAVAVDVDLSQLGAGAPSGNVDATTSATASSRTLAELEKTLGTTPRDVNALHELFNLSLSTAQTDRAWCAAHALVYLGAATAAEKTLFEKHRGGLIAPKHAVSSDAWTALLTHPDQEALIGEIFGAISAAVMMGRISAMRRDKKLPTLLASMKQDVQTSTIQSVRCLGWAATVLGMNTPAVFVDPDFSDTVDFVPALPSASRIGNKGLSGRTSGELAFLMGHHMVEHRADTIVRSLVPAVADLEGVYLAALTIGNPALPMHPRILATALPIAQAIQPLLEPKVIDQLRGSYQRFVEAGGRANLHRWSNAIEKTKARAGFLLANDLKASESAMKADSIAHHEDLVNDLLGYATSENYANLRKQIGIAIS